MGGKRDRYRLLVNGKVKVVGSLGECTREAKWHESWEIEKYKAPMQGVGMTPEWVSHKKGGM